jgi:hypothetical protein
MRINEVTAPPGSALAQAGVFGRAIADRIQQSLVPGGDFQDRGVGSAQQQGAAQEFTAASAARMGELMAQSYQQSLAKLMQDTRNPATGQPGVVNITQVPVQEVQRVIAQLIASTLQSLTNNRLPGLQKLPQLVSAQSRPQANTVVRQVDNLASTLAGLEPGRDRDDAQIQRLWTAVSKGLADAANLVQFQPASGQTATGATQARAGASPQQLQQAAQRSGLAAQSMRITTQIPPTNDPALNSVLGALGYLRT